MTNVFQKSTKPAIVEEWVDYYIFRRMAALLVPFFAKLGFTPNGVTWLGLGIGLLSAYTFLKGHLFLGSLLLWATVITDCVDGMLARYTGKSSPIGRVLDGLFDLIWTASIWLAIFFSGVLWEYGGKIFILWLMIFGGASMMLHCWTFDAIKNRYLILLSPTHNEWGIDSVEARRLMNESFGKKKYFESFMYGVMSVFQKVFAPQKDKVTNHFVISENKIEAAKIALENPMRLWTFCGEGTHHALMIFFGLLTALNPIFMMATFFIVAFVINTIWLIAFISWKKKLKEVMG